jgi:hypothetical protein
MNTQKLTIEDAAKFKKPYAYKMGGMQKITMPNGEVFEYDDRQYYSGRNAAKYNAGIRHDNIEVVVTKKELAEKIKAEKLRKKQITENLKKQKQYVKDCKNAEKLGIYNLQKTEHSIYVQLTNDEQARQYFNAKRLASTLNISVEDAEKLNSTGKTYVFAKTTNGKILMLFHPHLSCNNLSISTNEVSEEYLQKFINDWGVNDSKNHFVC